ncbi:hypothetical protein GCM10028777_33500 [Angustibacter speluncae]
MATVTERFEALDPRRWTAAYLPAWSSTHDAQATWDLVPDGLRLRVPDEHPLWCPERHPDPLLKVSGVQSGTWSGPVGGTRGQQPFREGLTVTEEQREQRGLVWRYGRVEVTCRAVVGPSSMFSAWMIGFEDEPDRCGELCLVEVFGDSVGADGTVAVGCGVHAFRDPALTEEFSADPVALDVGERHTYAVEWTPDGTTFELDGRTVRRSAQSPRYPMQLELAVFDFPGRGPRPQVPELVVESVVVESDELVDGAA